jgi:hypothetical protein
LDLEIEEHLNFRGASRLEFDEGLHFQGTSLPKFDEGFIFRERCSLNLTRASFSGNAAP